MIAVTAAIALGAAPAAAGVPVLVVQPDDSSLPGDAGYGQFYDDPELGCPANGEVLEVADAAGGFGIEAHVYARHSSPYSWQRVAALQVRRGHNDSDGFKYKCLTIPEGFEVKLSVWKYNGSDKWNRMSDFGVA